MSVRTDDNRVGPEPRSLREDLLHRRTLNQECARGNGSIPELLRNRLKIPMLVSQLVGAIVADRLRTHLVSDELGIRRGYVNEGQLGGKGLREQRRLLNHRFRDWRKVHRYQNLSHAVSSL